MADDEQERPEPIVLEMWDGHPIIQETVRIKNAGDGLSEALQVAPQLIRYGARHRIIMDVESAAVTYRAAKGFERGAHAPLQRIVELAAETVTILEPGASAHVDQLLADQKVRNEERREADRLAKTKQPRLTDEPGEAAEGTENGRGHLAVVPAAGEDSDGFYDPEAAGADKQL